LYGIRGKVTDQETSDPIRARIFVENHDSAYSVVHSSATHGDYYRLIKEEDYDLVVSAPGYYNDTIYDVSVTDYHATLLDIQLQAYGVSVPQKEAPVFRIYPNPAVHSFMVEPANISHGELELSVHSLDGRMIFQKIQSYQGSGIELSTNQMVPGIYLLRCTIGSLSEVHRLIVVKY
jgi:hypothetical protein